MPEDIFEGLDARPVDSDDPFAGLDAQEVEGPAPGPESIRDVQVTPGQIAMAQTTPEEVEKGKARARTLLEVGAGLGTLPLTGGLGSSLPALAIRSLLAGGAGTSASLLSETFDPTPGGEEAGPVPESAVGRIGRALKGDSAASRRALGTGAAFALGEGLGGLAGRGISRLARPVFRTSDPERVIARETIRRAGGVLPPAQATGSNRARLLQGMGESSTFGSGSLQAAKEGAEEIAKKQIDDFAAQYPERFGREELGAIVQDVLEGRTREFSRAAEQAYGNVDEALGRAIQRRVAQSGAVVRQGTRVTAEPTVSLLPLKREAEKLIQEASEGLPEGKLMGILRRVLEKPETVTFQAAQRLRSDLLREVRSGGAEPLSGVAKGTLKRVAGLVDDAMEKTAKDAGGEVLEAWRGANAGYRKGAELFNSRLIRTVTNAQPEAVVDAIVRANRPGTIRTARQAIGNAKAWGGVQRAYLERLLTRDSINRATEELSGQRILTNLSRFGDSAKELLGPERVRELERFARTLKVTQEQTGKGAGGVGIRAASELGGLSLLLSGRIGAGLTFGLAPVAVSKLFSNPTAVRVLTEGMKTSPGSKEAVRAFMQLSQILGRSALREEN